MKSHDDQANNAQEDAGEAAPSRRRLLILGAAGASAAMTIRPAFAQTAVSVMNCQIPVPGPGGAGQYIDAGGRLVPPGTKGAFPGAPRPFTGEEVKRAFRGQTLPGATYNQSQAYLQYIRRLQAGQSGFTCFASIQMPR
ncbi:hypothetical protein K5P26_05545 [Sphingopyxis sp. XHP0097]|uniref:Uncharacterized protein n=1 Tax=Sphingopyxis jiangsuensis TaxID=2871171 RepID=A0ABS7MC49_9SPHN|nr:MULTISPECIES: hypothetical protein [Sphingopyxis]MBY4636600.1 hypothetical protein [Sphingopyxis jiangsuensis]